MNVHQFCSPDNSPISKIDQNGETGTYYVTVIKDGKSTKLTVIDKNAVETFTIEGKAYPNGTLSADRLEGDHDFIQFKVINLDDPSKNWASAPIDKGKHNYEQKTDWSLLDEAFNIGGGIMIYGDAHSSEDSPGLKTKGNILGSFDFSEFNKVVGYILTAVKTKGENTLSKSGDAPGQKVPTYSHEKLAKWLDKAKSTEKELDKHKGSYCKDCKKVYDANGNPVEDDGTSLHFL